jgi:hypothetical protein
LPWYDFAFQDGLQTMNPQATWSQGLPPPHNSNLS